MPRSKPLKELVPLTRGLAHLASALTAFDEAKEPVLAAHLAQMIDLARLRLTAAS